MVLCKKGALLKKGEACTRTGEMYKELAQNQRSTGSSQVPCRCIQLKPGSCEEAACPFLTCRSCHGYPTDTMFYRQNEGPDHPSDVSTPQCRQYQYHTPFAMNLSASRAPVLHCGSRRGMGEEMHIISVYWMANHTLTHSFLRQESWLVPDMGC